MEQQAVQQERDEAVQTAPAPPQEEESRKKRRRKRCGNKHRPGKRQRELLKAAQARESGHQDGEQGEGATTGVQPANEPGLLGSDHTTLTHIAEDISWQRTQHMHPQTYRGPDARQQPRSRISNYEEWSGGAGRRWYGWESLEGMAGPGVWHPLPAVPYICYPFVTPYGVKFLRHSVNSSYQFNDSYNLERAGTRHNRAQTCLQLLTMYRHACKVLLPRKPNFGPNPIASRTSRQVCASSTAPLLQPHFHFALSACLTKCQARWWWSRRR